MSLLYAIAYPELASKDASLIDAIRREHDAAKRAIIGPHFTLVFGCDSVTADIFIAHVRSVAASGVPFEFDCRHATVERDIETAAIYAFLVPDEGRRDLIELHDRLNSGPLAAARRRVLRFRPHITLGAFDRAADAEALCHRLNENQLYVAGRISALAVVELNGRRLQQLATIALDGGV